MKEAYCSYEISKLLKEKGFDEKTTHWYNVRESLINDYPVSYENFFSPEKVWLAPTHQMACAWLREKGIEIDAYLSHITEEFGKKTKHYVFSIVDLNTDKDYPEYSEDYHYYPTYEKAVEAALKYSLETLL